MEVETEGVLDDDRLLRRVWYPDPSYIRDDMTATSLAFKLRKKSGETGLSVDIERVTSYEKSITDVSKFRLFSIVAKQVRAIGCDCLHKPEPENYAHAEITGNITNSVSSQLAKVAVLINYPRK
jgi:hypothetical protein